MIDVIVGTDKWTDEELARLWDFNAPTRTPDRFLPRILVTLGVAKSTSEVKRNRPDLFTTLCTPDYREIKYGRHRVAIIVN